MRKLYLLLCTSFVIGSSWAQVVTYDIPDTDLIGMVINSGDFCFDPGEYKQAAIGNTWGFSWTSTNSNTPSSVQVDLIFTIEEANGPYPTTLNASADIPANPPFAACGFGAASYTLTPSNYNPMGLNTLLFDYSGTTQQNQIIPAFGPGLMARVTVDYTPACNEPDVPTLSASPTSICEGQSATITTTGNLNDATDWFLYSDGCGTGGGGTYEQNNNTGVFTVSPTTTTTYYVRGEGGCSTPGTCGSITITVTPNADATITPAGPFCDYDGPVTLSAVDGGGTWSGTGIIDPVAGIFDPSVAGCGTHTITYTIGGMCGDVDTEDILVVCQEDATITPAGPFCVTDGSTNLTAADPGGTWSGTGITNPFFGTFDPATAGCGTHTITYTTGGFCPDMDTEDIVVNCTADATITPAGPFCASDGPTNLSAIDPGGTWSGTGITDAVNGTFDPSVAGVGTHTITYTISGSCGDVDTEDIVVSASLDATITAAGPFCDTDAATNLTAADPGGTWSGTGITDPVAGTFDPATAGCGTHTITYTISGSCGDTDTEDMVVICSDDPSFNYASTDFCENDPDQTVTITGTPGGTFSSSPGGLFVDPGTGSVAIMMGIPGSYVITYTTSGSCPASSNVNFNVHPLPDNTVNQSGEVLTAVSTTATYQWLDCNAGMAPIVGETGQVYTATANGDYAVEVTENGCVDTSACVNVNTIGLGEQDLAGQVALFPNPANEQVTVDLSRLDGLITLEIGNAIGQVIQTMTLSNNVHTIDISELESGMYTLRVITDDGHGVRQLLKE